MSFRPALLGVAVLLVLAGCVGVPPSTATTTTGPATTTSSATPTATIPQTPILVYENVSEPGREVLREAIENGPVEVSHADFPGPLSPDKDGWYVRHRGTLYEMSWEPHGLRGETKLDSVTRVNASTVEGSDGVVDYANLSTDARRLLNATLAGEETKAYASDSFPDQLGNNRYVRYQGEYYELRVVAADYIVYELSLSKADQKPTN